MTDLHSLNQSILVRQEGTSCWVQFCFLPWLILWRLGKEQLGRAFHKYNTSMDASTQSALVGVCFRNLSAFFTENCSIWLFFLLKSFWTSLKTIWAPSTSPVAPWQTVRNHTYIFFFGHAQGTWKLLGHGLNPRHSSDPLDPSPTEPPENFRKLPILAYFKY